MLLKNSELNFAKIYIKNPINKRIKKYKIQIPFLNLKKKKKTN